MMRALAATASLTVALLLRWLLTDADDPTACPGGRLYDPARGECPDLSGAYLLVSWRRGVCGRLLWIAGRRYRRDGYLADADYCVCLTGRPHPYHARPQPN